MNVPRLKFNSGTEIPQVGLGLWKVKKEKECKAAVAAGLEAGYRHFDTAQYYENEQFVGTVIAESSVPREEIFITTKIANHNFDPNRLAPSFEESLKKLQTDYVDLLLLHFPVSGLRQAAWKQLEGFAGDGRAKAIGVSNYTIRHLEELLAESEVVPAVNQVELHVFLQQPELVEFCQKRDILVEAYSPLAHGHGLDDPVLQELAKKHGKSTAQIMLRWCVEIGTVPLPKSIHPERIRENIEIFDFTLDAEDMAKLKTLDRGLRTCWDPTDVQ
jgi:diketogulonate reductase-like aldo/keto reductase